MYGDSLRIAGNDEAAISAYPEAEKHGAKGVVLAGAHLGLAVSYDALGRADDARDEIAAAIEVHPKMSVAFMRKYQPYKDQDYKERWLATLKRLGLPEE